MTANFRKTHALRMALAATVILGSLCAPALLTAADKSKSPVSDQMEIIQDNFKLLRKEARGKELGDKSIAHVDAMIAAGEKAREMTPPLADKKSGAEKDKFIADYKKEIDGMIASFKSLKGDLTAKKYDEAAKKVDKINEIKKKGHDKFTED